MHLEGTGKPGINVEASVGDMVNGTHDEFPSRWIPKPEKTEPSIKSATVSTPELSTDQVIMKAKQEKQARDYTSYGNKNKNGGKR